jgi:hypothetical protein
MLNLDGLRTLGGFEATLRIFAAVSAAPGLAQGAQWL